MESGDLVPDKLLVDVILASLEQTDGNFLLDGFPRNLDQAKVLDEHHDIDVVLRVDVPHAEIIERLSGRWVHAPSGRTYHTVYSPPKVAGKDDETGEDLIQRADDAPETVLNRLVTFDAMMQPIVDHYTAKGVLQVRGWQRDDGAGCAGWGRDGRIYIYAACLAAMF
jgi:adenylate kinase family enzyme